MPTGFVTHMFKSGVTGESREFAVFVPSGYNESARDWPMILFLHGIGERGDDIELVHVHGPLKEARLREDFHFIIVAPQCPTPAEGEGYLSSTWVQSEPDLLKIIDQVTSAYRVDKERLYLTGLSMGGFGCFSLAANHPGLFAAVAPLCGGGDATLAKAYEGTPFWVFHGEKDPVVPINRSAEMVGSMEAMGQEVKFTKYPDLGHDCWSVTYANDDLYAWFLEHELESD